MMPSAWISLDFDHTLPRRNLWPMMFRQKISKTRFFSNFASKMWQINERNYILCMQYTHTFTRKNIFLGTKYRLKCPSKIKKKRVFISHALKLYLADSTIIKNSTFHLDGLAKNLLIALCCWFMTDSIVTNLPNMRSFSCPFSFTLKNTVNQG